MTLKKQLIIALLSVGLIPFLVMGISSYVKSADALEKDAVAKLEMARELKKHEVKVYVNMVEAAIKTLGSSKDISNLVDALVEQHINYKVRADGPFNIINKSEVLNIYSEQDARYKKFIQDNKLYDMFIICKDHGHVMYTVTRESDLGENLSVGSLRDSGLAKAWKEALRTGRTAFADMEPYGPSNNEPAMFMATPIIDEGQVKGVVAVQLSPELFNEIMQNRTGMGESGETYLVGQDLLMRSDSYLDPKNHSLKASFANPTKGSVKTEATTDAFSGKSDTKVIVDYNGNPVYSSYTTIDVFGVKWALIAEMDEWEVLQAVTSLRDIAVVMGIIFIVVILGIALALGNFVSRPIISAVEVIGEGSNQVVSAANEIASAATSLADGSTQQASAVEEVSATVEESTAIINQSSENAREADILAKGANEAAEEGNTKVQELMVSMERTTEASEQIAKIVKTIDEIAFQTNLLALNAAVEAARAGEHGLGFAVVADEVKNLAQRSANAAKETTDIIEEAINQIKNGSEIASATNESFQIILDRAKKTSDLIGEIAISSREQAEGMTQIASSMSNIDEVTQQNAATSEEAAAAAEELSAQSVSMMDSINNLADVVGIHVDGATSASSSSAPRKMSPPKPTPHKQVAHKPAPRASKPISSKSDDIFPLGEDDLKEF
ncbi:MAG: methyl-accepting chemotaxis protein [Campylobacterales bacterium]|nr:methyl-accepting chemotaxis protein [Campylobacterales bacterium]